MAIEGKSKVLDCLYWLRSFEVGAAENYSSQMNLVTWWFDKNSNTQRSNFISELGGHISERIGCDEALARLTITEAFEAFVMFVVRDDPSSVITTGRALRKYAPRLASSIMKAGARFKCPRKANSNEHSYNMADLAEDVALNYEIAPDSNEIAEIATTIKNFYAS
jgi:hypothetical protein